VRDYPNDDWLAEERRRHGPVSEDDVHRGYDAYLDAVIAMRRVEGARPLGGAQ
jgi:hypothetical protein